MDLQKNRILIASGVLVVLLGGVYYLDYRRRAEYSDAAAEEESPLPPIVRDQISAVEITRPDQPVVKLEKRDGSFRVVAPVDYPADPANVDGLLDKLAELEFVSIVARNPSSHATLEVDDAHAIHVKANVGSRTVELRIGAYRGGNTMVRVGTSNDVIAVRGSLRYAFAREVREWRDRTVADVTPADVKRVKFTSDLGTWEFARDENGTFAPVGATIERFDATRVDGIVGALARLRATDFGSESDVAAANLAAPRGRVSLHVEVAAGPDGGVARVEDIELLLGAARTDSSDVYVQRQGNPTVYVAASHLADKLRPERSAFQQPVPVDGGVPAPAAEPPSMEAPGGGPVDLPPEVLQQLLQQAQQGGGH